MSSMAAEASEIRYSAACRPSARLALLMSRRWAVKKARPLTWVRVIVSSTGTSRPSAWRALNSMRWPRSGPPPRHRGHAGLHEGADGLARVPAEDQEPDAAARAVVLPDHLPQGLELPVVPGQAEAEVDLGADLQGDGRLEEQPVDADVHHAA